jgi:hypothetical protein
MHAQVRKSKQYACPNEWSQPQTPVSEKRKQGNVLDGTQDGQKSKWALIVKVVTSEG